MKIMKWFNIGPMFIEGLKDNPVAMIGSCIIMLLVLVIYTAILGLFFGIKEFDIVSIVYHFGYLQSFLIMGSFVIIFTLMFRKLWGNKNEN